MFRLANLLNALCVAVVCYALIRLCRRRRHEEQMRQLFYYLGVSPSLVEAGNFTSLFLSAIVSPTFTVVVTACTIVPSIALKDGGELVLTGWLSRILRRGKPKVVVVIGK